MTFDTDVLVWYLRGNARAQAFVAAVPFDRRWLSAMAYFELLQGCTSSNEVRTLRKFVGKNFSRVVPISEQISHRAGTLLERHAVSRGLLSFTA
jgi:predicted nucleic acid-binding protein